MMRAFCISLLLFASTGQAILGQANIAVPSASATRRPDCRSTTRVLADGTVQFADCNGQKTQLQREAIQPKEKIAHSASTAPRTNIESLDTATNAHYQAALQAQYDYSSYSYKYAQRTFEWQYWTGQIIFWIVLALVASGLLFSAIQFYFGLRHPLPAPNLDSQASENVEPKTAEASSEFEATLQGIKIKSSVLGLLILAMSMVFFFLYLKYVYTITNLAQ